MSITKYIGICCAMVLMAVASLRAQETPVQERMKALKVAFITQQLALTAEEAEAFWPVYNEMEAKLAEQRMNSNRLNRQIKQKLMVSDEAELETLADAFLEGKKKEYEIWAAYSESLKSVLPIRKLILLYRAEEAFKEKILEELYKRRMQQQQNRRRLNNPD